MKVLLAEDDRMLRLLMIEFLEDLDCTVDAVANGAEAVEAASDQCYDAIFMDCEMPILGGLAATRAILEQINERGLTPTPIIALTGHADAAEHARCREAGMREVLTKPVDFADLQTILERTTA